MCIFYHYTCLQCGCHALSEEEALNNVPGGWNMEICSTKYPGTNCPRVKFVEKETKEPCSHCPNCPEKFSHKATTQMNTSALHPQCKDSALDRNGLHGYDTPSSDLSPVIVNLDRASIPAGTNSQFLSPHTHCHSLPEHQTAQNLPPLSHGINFSNTSFQTSFQRPLEQPIIAPRLQNGLSEYHVPADFHPYPPHNAQAFPPTTPYRSFTMGPYPQAQPQPQRPMHRRPPGHAT